MGRAQGPGQASAPARRQTRTPARAPVWEDGGLSAVFADYEDIGLRALVEDESRIPADITESLNPDAKPGTECIVLGGTFTDGAEIKKGGRFALKLICDQRERTLLRIDDVGGKYYYGEPDILHGRPGAEGFELRFILAHLEALKAAGVDYVEMGLWGGDLPEALIAAGWEFTTDREGYITERTRAFYAASAVYWFTKDGPDGESSRLDELVGAGSVSPELAAELKERSFEPGSAGLPAGTISSANELFQFGAEHPFQDAKGNETWLGRELIRHSHNLYARDLSGCLALISARPIAPQPGSGDPFAAVIGSGRGNR